MPGPLVRLFLLLSLKFIVCDARMMYWKPRTRSKIKSNNFLDYFRPTKAPKQETKKRVPIWIDKMVTGTVKSGPRIIHHALYWITTADTIQSVLHNEYTDVIGLVSSRRKIAMVPSVYNTLFYFARLRPRLLYAVGALLRALQLCTPLGRIMDPTVGVGAGINLCAMLASSRWVKPLILGWATTKMVWKWLGATTVSRAYLPITLSLREWEDTKKNGSKKDS